MEVNFLVNQTQKASNGKGRTHASHRIWLRHGHPTQERSKSKGLLPPSGQCESLLTGGQQQGSRHWIASGCLQEPRLNLLRVEVIHRTINLSIYSTIIYCEPAAPSQRGDRKMTKMRLPALDEINSISLRDRGKNYLKHLCSLKKIFLKDIEISISQGRCIFQ